MLYSSISWQDCSPGAGDCLKTPAETSAQFSIKCLQSLWLQTWKSPKSLVFLKPLKSSTGSEVVDSVVDSAEDSDKGWEGRKAVLGLRYLLVQEVVGGVRHL